MKIIRNNKSLYKEGHLHPGDDGNIHIAAGSGNLNINTNNLSGVTGNVISPTPIIHNDEDSDREYNDQTQQAIHSTGIIKWYNTNQIINEQNAILSIGSGDIVGRKCQITSLTSTRIQYTNSDGTQTIMNISAGETLDFVYNGTGWICMLGNVISVLESLVEVE